MKVLLDMNISPEWVAVFAAAGLAAHHWSRLGDARAPDREIMDYARDNGYVIFTHDLDFGVALALTKSRGPSVVQLRDQDILPMRSTAAVMSIFSRYRHHLTQGALSSIDRSNHRVRVLPL
jgi:predicted nuclease of predicted toxin-antitoxin system